MNSKKICKVIGTIIRDNRSNMDLTIEELSEIVGIAPGFLGLIERGQRGTSLKNLFKLANVFEISMDELTGFKNIENKKELTENQINYLKLSAFLKALNENDINYFINNIKDYIKTKKLNNLDTNIDFKYEPYNIDM